MQGSDAVQQFLTEPAGSVHLFEKADKSAPKEAA
jgi:hypothetical protein